MVESRKGKFIIMLQKTTHFVIKLATMCTTCVLQKTTKGTSQNYRS